MRISLITILILSFILHSCKADTPVLEPIEVVESVIEKNKNKASEGAGTDEQDVNLKSNDNSDKDIAVKNIDKLDPIEQVVKKKENEQSAMIKSEIKDHVNLVSDKIDSDQSIKEVEETVTVKSETIETQAENLQEAQDNVNEDDSLLDVLSHDIWNDLLRMHVTSEGVVDYQGFKRDYPKFKMYLESLKNNAPKDSWQRAKKMSYWINAYNAFTVDLIVSNYPIASITDLDGGDPWKVKRIEIDGNSYSLNDIEHVILRPTFKDARIHFAVNCAAKSCPKLSNTAFTPENLESKLESLTKQFVNNRTANQFSSSSIKLSKIFEWYKVDFGDLLSFINKYSDQSINTKVPITYNDYNWALNE